MPEHQKIIIFEDTNLQSDFLIKKWKELAYEAISLRGRFTMALCSGRSVIEFYTKLANIDDPELWAKIHVYLTDERFVDAEHKDSNMRYLKHHLLDHVLIPHENIHFIPTHVDTIELAAEEYKERLIQNFSLHEGLPCFDFVLLGVADDGHVASLFQDIPDIAAPRRLTIPVSLNHLKHERISLSMSVFNNSRFVVGLLNGPNKAEIAKLLLEEEKPLPAKAIHPKEGQYWLLITADAAVFLTDTHQFSTPDVLGSSSFREDF